jgi:hypothetical protein
MFHKDVLATFLLSKMKNEVHTCNQHYTKEIQHAQLAAAHNYHHDASICHLPAPTE